MALHIDEPRLIPTDAIRLTDIRFNPLEIDLMDANNWGIVSPNLYRIQKFTTGDYGFRHHLETNVESENALRDITWKRIRSIQDLDGIVKVRLNHLGNIVSVGDY